MEHVIHLGQYNIEPEQQNASPWPDIGASKGLHSNYLERLDSI